jgi:hypothetical protein
VRCLESSAVEFARVDLWLGRFPSFEAAEAYFEEQYDDEEAPVSRFAGDQDETFIDHDFVERVFHETSPPNLRDALTRHSFSSSYVDAAVAAFEQAPFYPFDTVLLVWSPQVTSPRSVSGDDMKLHYVGRFVSDT